MHWAAHLIGAPYEAGACGPTSFDCIGLVRHYFKARHGVALPDYQLAGGTPEGLHAFVRATKWQRVTGEPQDEDIVTMESFVGKHVGVALRTDEGIGLLHAVGTDNRGSVVWQPLNTLVGYRNLEAWRSPCKL